MLTIAPDFCARIIGRACLQASMVPRRLISKIRSKASVETASRGASPPSTLIPTLLCSMSRRLHSSALPRIAASSAVSSLTSAARAAVAGDLVGCLLCRFQVTVAAAHLRPFPREEQRRCASVTDRRAKARRLSPADNDRCLSFEPHVPLRVC